MDKLQITEINCTTGETIVRDATVEEIVQREADIAAETVKQAEAQAQATARAAILDRLGLTAEEAAILLS
jgi:23S rRNA maturation mini-RNase III